MNLIQAYEGVLIELDKFAAPSFAVDDFNYYWAKAYRNVLNREYSRYDVKQLTTDNLAPFVRQAEIAFTPVVDDRRITPLPPATGWQAVPGTPSGLGEYEHLLLVTVTLKKIAARCGSEPIQKIRTAKRLTADMEGFIHDNHYHRPSAERVFYRLIGRELEIVFDTRELPQTAWRLDKLRIIYLMAPATPKLLADKSNGTQVSGEFTGYMATEVLNECVRLFLENVEQPRLQTHPAVNPPLT